MQHYFISGIGTGIGKTLVSAVLTEALHADYWKPVQSGDLENSDSMTVQSLISNETTIIHPEVYRLSEPMSPHASAKIDGIRLELDAMLLPKTERPLIIEGAGGLMVPLNEQDLMIDLIEKLKVPVVLVSQHYLGSINHTLLSLELLKTRKIPVAGLIFNGPDTPSTSSFLQNYSDVPYWGHIPTLKHITKEAVQALAAKWKALVPDPQNAW